VIKKKKRSRSSKRGNTALPHAVKEKIEWNGDPLSERAFLSRRVEPAKRERGRSFFLHGSKRITGGSREEELRKGVDNINNFSWGEGLQGRPRREGPTKNPHPPPHPPFSLRGEVRGEPS